VDKLREGWLMIFQAISEWAYDNPDVILLVGTGLVLCGIALAIRHIWRRWLKGGTTKVYHKVLRNPVRWLLRPFNRLHRRWSEQNLGIKMAKWKKELIANIFYEGLTQACDEHLISKHDKRRLMKELAHFFDIADLKKPNNHKEALKKKILENREFQIGPKGEIPGGKPGENVVPLYKGLGEEYLSRKKASA